MPLIYDWRAPISSLFYDYDAGRASYEAPGGTVEGEIVKNISTRLRRAGFSTLLRVISRLMTIS